MSRFAHDWTESSFRLFVAPHGSQQVDVGSDGAAGGDGSKGTTGDNATPPGPGSDGGKGDDGGSATVDGTALKFSKAHPLSTWLESATGGSGGNGGEGGDAGSFPAHKDYGQQWANGGYGADGGRGGDGIAYLNGATIYGRTGTTNADGITFTMTATGSNGGAGGNAGNGDGLRSSTNAGGLGGNGGYGGDGGQASASLGNTILSAVRNGADPNHFQIVLDVTAHAGNGGDAGNGGKGGAGSPAGTGGAGGNAGFGGGASASVLNNTFNMQRAGGGTSQLTIVMDARGGDGGDGGAAGHSGGANGVGGQAGEAGVTFENNTINGGAEDDTVRLQISAQGGKGGVSGDGLLHEMNGNGFDLVDGNSLDGGGGGHNALLFSWAGGTTNVAINIDLDTGALDIGAGSSTVLRFQDVTGGSEDDSLTGNDVANVLNGAAGDDFLTGGLGGDKLTGGTGHDKFIFFSEDDSTSTHRDTITDMNFDQDRIGVEFNVSHIDAAIGGATISGATFDADMAAAAHNLRAEHAVLVTATHGGLKNHVFLVIGVDGVKGYQGGSDIVIDVTGVTGTMTAHDFFNAH